MKKGLSEIACVLDRSGSMSSIIGDAIGGFNAFLKGQKEVEGEANMTVALFDSEYDLLYDNININEVNDLDSSTYVPRGSTSLHDAIGRTINTIGARLRSTPEEDRPENVIVAILTDGDENTSREFDASKIKEMIGHQESKYNWKFLYLAANQDAFAVGSGMGFNIGNSINFNATAKGSTTAYANMNLYSSSVRCCADVSNFAQDMALSEDDVTITNATTGDAVIAPDAIINS